MVMIFRFPISLSTLRLISKSAERNHSNYRRSGNRKSTIIDGLIDKGFVVTQKFPEVTLEAKKQGIEQLFRKAIVIQRTTS
jgi:hypothetical protein